MEHSPFVCDSDQLAHIVALITQVLEATVSGQSCSDAGLYCCFLFFNLRIHCNFSIMKIYKICKNIHSNGCS